MKYCIIYASTNILSDEKISIGLVCVSDSGWHFDYSKYKVGISSMLLSADQCDYVSSFISSFRANFLEGRNPSSILSSLDTLHRYSNNYVIFSPVMELNISEDLLPPEKLFRELVGSC